MKQLIYIIGLFLLAACNEDKGNYDYTEINAVSVGLDKMYSYRLEKDTTVTITPRLSQSLEKDKKHLKFVWLHSTTNHNFYGHGKFDTISVEENLRFHIDPEGEKIDYTHYFRLNVLEETTGIEYPVNTTIKLIKPYDGAWMILHRKNDQTALGAVEYMGDRILSRTDIYYEETGRHLQGLPLCLGQYRGSCKYYGTGYDWNMFSVITDDPEEAGVYCQWKKFQQMDKLQRMVAPMARGTFDYSRVKMIDAGSSYGALCLSSDVLYQSPSAMKIYKANVDLDGEVKITHASRVAFASLLYDEGGHRFCYYSNTGRDGSYDPKVFSEENENNAQYAVKTIPVRDGNVVSVDPSYLPADQRVLYVGAGYNYIPGHNWGFYAYGLSKKGQDSCFVYEFSMYGIVDADEGASFPAYYRLKLPKGLDENSCFASTMAYSGFLFYTAGNTVYRLDFKQAGGKATAIYTHPAGTAVKMKFARKGSVEEDDDGLFYTGYEFDLNRSLGVAFDLGNGQSDFVILNLSDTGGVGDDSESYPALQVYPEFGEVSDFLFL